MEIEDTWSRFGFRGAGSGRMVDVEGEGSGVGVEKSRGDAEGVCCRVRGRAVDVAEDEGGEGACEEANKLDKNG